MDEQEQMNQQAALIMGRQGYAQSMNSDINSLLSELTNPEEDIKEVELSLKGIEIDNRGKEIQKTKPLLNELGVANMIRFLRAMLSRVMFMSNLDEDQIRILTIELGETIMKDLIFHKKEYDCEDKEDRSTVIRILTYKAFESGMTALENGFRRFLKSGIIETTINTQGNPIKSGGKGGGLMSAMLGMGKK